jgi:hypothetical protein
MRWGVGPIQEQKRYTAKSGHCGDKIGMILAWFMHNSV